MFGDNCRFALTISWDFLNQCVDLRRFMRFRAIGRVQAGVELFEIRDENTISGFVGRPETRDHTRFSGEIDKKEPCGKDRHVSWLAGADQL